MQLLIDLLPGSPNKVLKKSIDKVHLFQIYIYFAKVAISAAETFLAGDLSQFDPHVGDTACQIRAYRTLQLSQSPRTKLTLEALIKKLNQIIDNIASMNVNIVANTPKSPFISSRQFITMHGLDVPFDEESIFVFTAFFLSKYTHVNDAIRVNTEIKFPSLYEEVFFCSRSSLYRYIIKLQRILSEDSCNFLKFLSLHNQKITSLTTLVVDTLWLDEMGRYTVPSFLSGYIILTSLISSSTNIMLLCKMKNKDYLRIAFRGNPNTQKFDLLENAKTQSPYFAIKGDSSKLSSRDEVLSYIQQAGGLLQLLLKTMACHPQYRGRTFEPNNNKTPFDQFSKFSEETTGWFNKLYVKMSALGEKYFVAGSGKYFRARHIFNLKL